MGSDWRDFLSVPIDEFVKDYDQSLKLIIVILSVVFRDKFEPYEKIK